MKPFSFTVAVTPLRWLGGEVEADEVEAVQAAELAAQELDLHAVVVPAFPSKGRLLDDPPLAGRQLRQLIEERSLHRVLDPAARQDVRAFFHGCANRSGWSRR
jgi:hypothetical protein